MGYTPMKQDEEIAKNVMSASNDVLTTKINFVLFIEAENCNPNGNPGEDNMPRMDLDDYGVMSPECIKRKERNRMQDIMKTVEDENKRAAYKIFCQADGRIDDGYKSLQERAVNTISGIDENQKKKNACAQYADIRAFGTVIAYKAKGGPKGVSLGIKGPVTICEAKSVNQPEIFTMDITKSTNGSEKEDDQKASDRMGHRHEVVYGLYKVCGSINAYHAENTQFTVADAELIKETLLTLFRNDESAARPAGSMRVVKLYWFEHSSKGGQYTPYQIFSNVNAEKKDEVEFGAERSSDDFRFTTKESINAILPELSVKIYDGE